MARQTGPVGTRAGKLLDRYRPSLYEFSTAKGSGTKRAWAIRHAAQAQAFLAPLDLVLVHSVRAKTAATTHRATTGRGR